jgi:hypothetical protein
MHFVAYCDAHLSGHRIVSSNARALGLPADVTAVTFQTVHTTYNPYIFRALVLAKMAAQHSPLLRFTAGSPGVEGCGNLHFFSQRRL